MAFDADAEQSYRLGSGNGRPGPAERVHNDPLPKRQGSPHNLTQQRLRLETRMVGNVALPAWCPFAVDDILEW